MVGAGGGVPVCVELLVCSVNSNITAPHELYVNPICCCSGEYCLGALSAGDNNQVRQCDRSLRCTLGVRCKFNKFLLSVVLA